MYATATNGLSGYSRKGYNSKNKKGIAVEQPL